jgi:hypothetical protein
MRALSSGGSATSKSSFKVINFGGAPRIFSKSFMIALCASRIM